MAFHQGCKYDNILKIKTKDRGSKTRPTPTPSLRPGDQRPRSRRRLKISGLKPRPKTSGLKPKPRSRSEKTVLDEPRD